MPPVQIKVGGLTRAIKAVERLREFGADPTDLLDIWGGVLEASVRRRFDTGKGPGGIPWPTSWRARADGGKTLVDKGNLESSLRFETTPNRLEIGFDGTGASSKFAYVHQFGATIYPRTAGGLRFPVPGGGFIIASVVQIPRRPMLGVDAEDRADMKTEAIEHLRRILYGNNTP